MWRWWPVPWCCWWLCGPTGAWLHGRRRRCPPESAGYMAPVPGLIHVACAIVGRVRQLEAIGRCVAGQPSDCRCRFEFGLQVGAAGGAYVDGTPGVMLAEERRGRDRKDLLDALPLVQLALDDALLPFDASEGRYQVKRHALGTGSRFQ
ncbi:hypothetical protein QT21_00145, partial [Staphylococcus aureus]